MGSLGSAGEEEKAVVLGLDEEAATETEPSSFLADHTGKGFALLAAGVMYGGFRFGIGKAETFAEEDGRINKMLEKAGAPRKGGKAVTSAATYGRGSATATSAAGASNWKRPRAAPRSIARSPSGVAMKALGAGTALCLCGAGVTLFALSRVTGIHNIQQLSDRFAASIPEAHRRLVERLGIKVVKAPPMTQAEEDAYLHSILYEGGDGSVDGDGHFGGGSSVSGAEAGTGAGGGTAVEALRGATAPMAGAEDGVVAASSEPGFLPGTKKKRFSALDEAMAWWSR